MHQTEELIDILREAIQGLTDRDIVDMDLCQIGLAFFPRMHRAIASPCFVDGSWHQDREIREGWDDLLGEGFPVSGLPILTLLDNGEIEHAIHSPELTVDNQAWTRQQARLIRTQMTEAIPYAAKHLAAALQG